MRISQLIAYALPALALAMPTIPIYIYLPSFYATDVGLGLAAVGGILLAARIFDTVTDPIVGMVSDRLTWRWGRRKPLMLFGGIIAASAMFALAHPPSDAGSLYLLIWAVTLYAGWTLVMVPYTSWGAEIVSDYDARSKITAGREAATLIGILIASTIPVVIATGAEDASEAESLKAITWAALIIGVPTFIWIALGVPDKPISKAPPLDAKRIGWRNALRTLYENKPFLRLFCAWFMNGLANGLPAVLFLLYMQHGLNISEDERPLYMLAYFLPAVLGVPIWAWLSGRGEKHRVWCLAMLIASAAFAVVPFLSPETAWVFMIVCVITGATLGADLALPPSIQADVVDYDRLKSGRDRTGVYFALWGMATKLALALSVGIAFPALDLAGFDPTVEKPEAIWALVVIYALFPVVLKVLAVMIVAPFPISRCKHEIIRRRLKTFVK